ncbi:H0124B04.16 protein, related [Eimeria mitis]|uniref:RNA-directed DNA polymerase n=1 Tax=Eimeria mitis TaxID=44415 RepID=U6KAF4_9EIME|nr:H0124B04.16 protein, related [Eimeria mitis]CDJ32458.1 H0124B04.16 protein, related [Eimeria mitis]
MGKSAVLELEITGRGYEGLLDTGASRSFIRPAVVEQLGLKVRNLREAFSFTAANGAIIHIDKEVPRFTMLCGGECFTGDFLAGPITFPIIMGIDWLVNHKVTWYFQSDKIRTYVNGRWCDLPVLPKGSEATTQRDSPNRDPAKTAADSAYEELAAQVAKMSVEEATALLRPPPKRYKLRHKAGERVRIKDILQRAREDTANLKRALEGLHFVVALPATEPERVIHVPTERQGPLLYALVEHTNSLPTRRAQTLSEPGESTVTTHTEDDESPWPKAQQSYTEFDAWMTGPEATRVPEQILTVLQQHRKLFPDSLPDGLPPKTPYDHRILLLPGKLPTRAPIYKMPPDQLAHHNKEIARLMAKGWIGPTYLPICAPTIMVDKRDDGSGERRMRMVVNYQALNALTIEPEFPMPSVQTVLEMLGGAAYFSTLDLEAGFHQIRMAREDRWKTAFRSVQGLSEYKVMPFGLKGSPATFQANINAYLQPLLGKRVIAYLDDVLVCSASLESHARLLEQVLGIFLRHQFYPKLTKCKFGQRDLTYLGYRIGADGIRPAADKVEAINLWPEVITNETQVRQFLGTVNYCRMFMGPTFADLSRPLVELTHRNSPFTWKEEHSAAVRQLKRLLSEYTILQVPDPKEPYTLYTDASGSAVGAILEQEGKPVGFLSQVMNATQQRYSIYDQELLALISALDKWRHLLRGAEVTAYTDHQALTYLQQNNAHKPLRGRTARWLDFLAEFPQLTISYLQGTHNTVADALSRHPQHQSAASTTTPTLLVPLAGPQQVTTSATPRYSTRSSSGNAPKIDFRAIAGFRSHRRRSKQTSPTSPDPLIPPPAGTPVGLASTRQSSPPLEPSDSPSSTVPSPSSSSSAPTTSVAITEFAPESPAVTECLTPQRSEDCYRRCPHFRGIVLAADRHNEAEFLHQLQGRRYRFKFCRPYLYVCIHGLWRICPPTLPEFLSHLLYRHHDHVTAGHRGERKTFLSLSKLYYWPGMRVYTTAYVESYVKCRASKALSQRQAGLLQPLLVPSRRWSHVSLDFITDLPLTPRGHDCILVIVDSLSKMVHFIRTKKTATTADTIELLADRWIRYHGVPDVLISDRDPRFQSQLWQQLCQRFHIKRAMSSPYHPQSDGQRERVNRTLEQMLRTYIQTDEREWERLLPALELAYNTTSHSSTEPSPFEIMIGQNPVTAADLDIVGNLAPTLTPPMTKVSQQLCDRAQSHILKAKWQQKRYAEAHRRDVQYKPGDQIWISSRHLPGLNQCPKLEPRFRGPFTILERIRQVGYRIALPPTYSCHNVFHVSQLVPDRPRDPQRQSKEAAVGWLPITGPDGTPTDTYKVEYILNQRGSGQDVQYLVKWRGAPENRATWEPVANLTNCPTILRAWRRYFKRAKDTQRSPQDTASSSAHTNAAGSLFQSLSSRGGKRWCGAPRQPHRSGHCTAQIHRREIYRREVR